MFQEWIDQARRDLEMAAVAMREGFHEWACYCSQQSAEKALKTLVQLWNPGVHENVHESDKIVKLLPFQVANRQVKLAATTLDPYNKWTRYPVTENQNRAPLRVYTKTHSATAIQAATQILEYVERVSSAVQTRILDAVKLAQQIQ